MEYGMTAKEPPMIRILNRNIKDLITDYPAIVRVLEERKIGCTTCNVGTCQLKDIIEIHNLSEDAEKDLFSKIAAIVFPGESVEIPKPARAVKTSESKKLSPPLLMLVNEHTHIKKVIGAIDPITRSLETTLPRKKDDIILILDFIRNYADRFHHAKEEDILFKQFDETDAVIAAMRTEHERGRGYVRAAAQGLQNGDAASVADNLVKYGALLTDHIRKEDDVLYPWMDRNMSDSVVGRLFSQFREMENSDNGNSQRYVDFADRLQYNN